MRTQIEYTAQKITLYWIELAQAAGMRPFSKLVSHCLMFNRTWNVIGLLSRKENDFALKSYADIF